MSSKDMNVGELLKTANRLKREGQLEEAIALYHQVIESNPNFSWAYHNLGDAFVKQGKFDEAVAEYQKAIKINPNSAWFIYSLVNILLKNDNLKAAAQYLAKGISIKPKNFYEQGLFVDCGGYDGCSCIKFLMSNPNYICVTFEPNPDLWSYYDEIPTKLVKKAVFTYDGLIEFIVDPVNADGSSLLKEKKIDFTEKFSNADCPKLTVDCVDLSTFISQVSEEYSSIVLKLDIEGAEYDVLEKMVEKKTIAYIDKLYCEFHGQKAKIPKARHDKLIERLKEFIAIEEWDSMDMSIHCRGSGYKKIRDNILKSINLSRKLQ